MLMILTFMIVLVSKIMIRFKKVKMFKILSIDSLKNRKKIRSESVCPSKQFLTFELSKFNTKRILCQFSIRKLSNTSKGSFLRKKIHCQRIKKH